MPTGCASAHLGGWGPCAMTVSHSIVCVHACFLVCVCVCVCVCVVCVCVCVCVLCACVCVCVYVCMYIRPCVVVHLD